MGRMARPRKYFIEVGDRFGRWLVIDNQHVGAPLCRCDCGSERHVSRLNLARGMTNSCGCGARGAKRGNTYGYKHGHATGGKSSPEYRAWAKAKDRCFNPRCPEYFRYGGRGIAMCDRWRDSFAAFLEDMGLRPSPKHSIDRIDNDGNYAPGNCRWATQSEQNANRRPYTRRSLKG